MSTLSTDDLVRGLTAGMPIAPFSLKPRLLSEIVDHVRAQQMTLQTRSDDTKRLYALLSDSLKYLRDDRLQALTRCEIYLLPLPITLGFCEKIDDREIIVIPSGLVDLIASTLSASYVEGLIPDRFQEFYLLSNRHDMPLTELVANAHFLLRLQFFTDCELLPDFRAAMTTDMLRRVHDAVSGAVLFIILHELGHLTLGHLDGEKPRPVQHSLAVPERLGKLKKQEFEADQFANDSLIDEAAEMATYWQDMAVQFHAQMEIVAGGRQASHPLAINRRYHAALRRGKWYGQFTVDSSTAYFETMRQKFLDTEIETQQGLNRFVETPRERVLGVLCEALAFLKDSGADLTPIVGTSWSPWINMYDPRTLD